MGGDDICGWCDSGVNRDGTKWSIDQTVKAIGNGQLFGECPEEGCERVSSHPGPHSVRPKDA